MYPRRKTRKNKPRDCVKKIKNKLNNNDGLKKSDHDVD